MQKRRLNASMAIALTLLTGGLTTQITDYFELFGHNSFIPLIIGLTIIFVGITAILLLRLITKNKSKQQNTP